MKSRTTLDIDFHPIAGEPWGDIYLHFPTQDAMMVWLQGGFNDLDHTLSDTLHKRCCEATSIRARGQ